MVGHDAKEVITHYLARQVQAEQPLPPAGGARRARFGSIIRVVAAAASQRLVLLFASAACFALVTATHVAIGGNGYGVSHFYYVPIALAALATNRRIGAAAGLVALGLFALSCLLSPRMQLDELTNVATVTRGIAYVSLGALIGWSASSNRRLVQLLRERADRDPLTGLLNVRPFERELTRRCKEEPGFALLVGEVEDLQETSERDGYAAGNVLLRRTAAALDELAGADEVAARLGGSTFALLVEADSVEHAGAVAARYEHELERRRLHVSVGWAYQPVDGTRPAELRRRADERLARAKAARTSREMIAGLLTGAVAASG